MSKRSKTHESPIPAYSEPESAPLETVAEESTAETKIVVEEDAYQLEQETVEIVDAVCPRCGSSERTRLKEIAPRIETSRGTLVRYRTQCLGKIQPVDKDGKPVVDGEGKPVSYECGNRYKARKIIPNTRTAHRKGA